MNWLKEKLNTKPSFKFDFNLELPNFRKKTNIVLGIDITTTVVKLLEFSKHGKHYRVESYMVAPLPRDAVVDKQLTNVQIIGEAIKKAVDRSGTHLKQAAVAVGGSSVITKLITLPAGLSDDEMIEQIMIEAEQYIPFSVDDVMFDFQLEGINEIDSSRVNVLLAASRRENVEDRVAALRTCRIKGKNCRY
jgi:type IV pilus assembly protein PilM